MPKNKLYSALSKIFSFQDIANLKIYSYETTRMRTYYYFIFYNYWLDGSPVIYH